jgi:hypothetical protein
MSTKPVVARLALLSLLLVVVGAAPAWADREVAVSPSSGPPGSTFTITGSGFDEAEVELHWDTLDGPLLTRAAGPDFSVPATVPEGAPSNSHRVVAVARDGSRTSTSTSAFQVTTAPDETPTATTSTIARDAPPPTSATPETTTPAAGSFSTVPRGAIPAVGGRSSPGVTVPATAGETDGPTDGRIVNPAAAAAAEAAGAAAIAGLTAAPPGQTPTSAASAPASGYTGDTTGGAGTPGRGANGSPAGAALAPSRGGRSSTAVRPLAALVVVVALATVACGALLVRNRRAGPPADLPISP